MFIAKQCGVTVPAGTRVLLAHLEGVGRDYPLSIEKLCPVLSFYVVKDWREGCERCKQILRYGGMGHTMSIHSKDDQVILEFGLKKPAFRIVVNTPTTHGSIGLTTGLDPAMTLGCGGYGGNITSDNISPKHLLNVKRLAYELSAVANRFEATAPAAAGRTGAQLPAAPNRPEPPKGISAQVLSRRIDEFLDSRGYRIGPTERAAGLSQSAPVASRPANQTPLEFVCEDDVRLALRLGQKLVLSERAIVTPAARDLGEEHKVFMVAPWRG
jgi:acetaldehyde dehydrogenase (acetylating)